MNLKICIIHSTKTCENLKYPLLWGCKRVIAAVPHHHRYMASILSASLELLLCCRRRPWVLEDSWRLTEAVNTPSRHITSSAMLFPGTTSSGSLSMNTLWLQGESSDRVDNMESLFDFIVAEEDESSDECSSPNLTWNQYGMASTVVDRATRSTVLASTTSPPSTSNPVEVPCLGGGSWDSTKASVRPDTRDIFNTAKGPLSTLVCGRLDSVTSSWWVVWKK